MTTKKRKAKVVEPLPVPVNTCASSPMVLERPQSEAAKTTEEMEHLNTAIQMTREAIRYHSQELTSVREQLTNNLLRHAELKAKLEKATAVPPLAN